MAKKNLPYPAEKIGELLIEVDNEVAKKSDLNDFVKKESGRGLSTNDYTTAEKTKLAGIQEGAQKNAVTSIRGALQLNPQVGNVVISAADIGLGNANTRLTSLENNKLDKSEKGATNGVASLDENGRVPSSQLPSYVDDVIDDLNFAQFPATGETGKIYIAKDTNKTYRWSGNGYAEVSASLALGETEQTAYSGAKGKKNAEDIAKLAKDLDETHQLASNAESAISEVVELTIPAIEDELENKLGKTEKAADSAKLGGVELANIRQYVFGANDARTIPEGTDFDTLYGDENLGMWQMLTNITYTNSPITNGAVMVVRLQGGYCAQLLFPYAGGQMYYRAQYWASGLNWFGWRQIALTDSTVANAEKLGGVAAAEYMQKSGGTINGDLSLNSQGSNMPFRVLKFTKSNGNVSAGEILFQSANMNGLRIASVYGDYASRQDLIVYTSNNVTSPYEPIWMPSLTVKHTGNIGIGTTAPTEKLEVSGNVKATKFIGTLQGDVSGVLNITGETGYSEGIRIHPVSGISSIWLCAINNTGYDAGMWGITAMQGGNLRFRGGASAVADLMVITQGGRVGIGTTSPTEKLEVAGNIKASGTVTATATYHSSDERLKTFEGDVEVDLEKLKALPKKYFHWTADADGKRQLGTSAQAVEKLFPELVSTDAYDHKSVNYANLSIVALAAIDKLAEKNDKLAEQNTELSEKNAELSKKNAELERRLAKIEKLLNIE